MKERPIIMTAESVRAILGGRKTQTRRVIKPQPALHWSIPPARYFEGYLNRFGVQVDEESIKCPYGLIGDRLWVKEVFAYVSPHEGWAYKEDCLIEYKADTMAPYPGDWPPDEARGNPDAPKWSSPWFMPRKLSRLDLVITDIWAERVQEITLDDACDEGIPECVCDGEYFQRALGAGCGWDCDRDPVRVFVDVWDQINSKRGYPWADNPWVWVIEFERIKP